MEPPRLIATDLDGTLLRSDLSVSERTRQALAGAREVGLEVVLATGRPPRALSPSIRDAVGGQGLVICANGALVHDFASGKVVRSSTIAPEVAGPVVGALRSAIPGAAFAVEGVDRFGHEPSYVPVVTNPAAVVAALEELLAEPVAKILALHPDRPPDQLVAEIRQVVAGAVEVTHSSARGLAEISAVGVSKAFALSELATERGVAPTEAVAFGDMPNDLPMLAWAGWSVAVANAHPEVLAAADQITASNDDDGVAVVIEKILAYPSGQDKADPPRGTTRAAR